MNPLPTLLLLALTLLPGPTLAAPATNPTTAPATRPDPLADLAFLAGSWTGSLQNDPRPADEAWTRPAAGNMTGCFRWLRPDGTPIVLEILTLTAEPDAVRLRLRHFGPNLAPRDDKPQTLRLTKVAPNLAEFTSEKDAPDLAKIIYDARTPNTLRIEVHFQPRPDATRPRPPLIFLLRTP